MYCREENYSCIGRLCRFQLLGIMFRLRGPFQFINTLMHAPDTSVHTHNSIMHRFFYLTTQTWSTLQVLSRGIVVIAVVV
jgi:hypothetical protein